VVDAWVSVSGYVRSVFIDPNVFPIAPLSANVTNAFVLLEYFLEGDAAIMLSPAFSIIPHLFMLSLI
jgi:hypothetical protein